MLNLKRLWSRLTQEDFGNLANVCRAEIGPDRTYATVAHLYVYLVFQLESCALWPLAGVNDILNWIPSIYQLLGECSIIRRLLENRMFLASIDEASMKWIGGQPQIPVPFIKSLLNALKVERGADYVELLVTLAKAAVLERNNEDSPVLFSLVLSRLGGLKC